MGPLTEHVALVVGDAAGVAPSCEASNDGQRQRAGSGAVSSQNAPRSWATDR